MRYVPFGRRVYVLAGRTIIDRRSFSSAYLARRVIRGLTRIREAFHAR